MRALLLKDLRASAVWIAPVMLFYLLTAVSVSRAAQAFFWLGIGLVAALVALVPAVEWRFETDRLISSFPVARSSVVRARMAAALVAVTISLALWAGCGLALEALVRRPAAFAASWMNPAGILAFILAAVALIALFLPCYFRYGLGKGSGVFGMLAMALTAVVWGSAPAMFRDGSSPAVPRVTEPSGALRALVVTTVAEVGAIPAVLLIVAGMAVVLWLSMRVSTVFYARREF